MYIASSIINKVVSDIDHIELVGSIHGDTLFVSFTINVTHKELEKPLVFDVKIYSPYPFQNRDSESIKFYNINLISYNHVMEDGGICIHTSNNPNLKQKLTADFNSLKHWIEKYYINKEEDHNYEHILVPESRYNDEYYSFFFTNVDYAFETGDYGEVKIAQMTPSTKNGVTVRNSLLQSFQSCLQSGVIFCRWSDYFNSDQLKTSLGLYYFLENQPANYGKFAWNSWSDLKESLPKEFLSFIHNFEKTNVKKHRGRVIPFFIGYNISSTEIHWQVILLTIGSFPIKGEPILHNGKKTGQWESSIIPNKINWGITRNCSYEYFFGRGRLCDQLTKSKILLIGIGAVGSAVATSLVRGGIKVIDLVDYDSKEPENVCRSEYMFSSGITQKTEELGVILQNISPHVNVRVGDHDFFDFYTKLLHKDLEAQLKIKLMLEEYDLIIDCSTDNDLMYQLEELKLNAQIINLSISNYAQNLVCAFSPNIYGFVTGIYKEVINKSVDTDDLYNPTGCWSPTFKASYTDVNLLTQYAIRQIDLMLKDQRIRNFRLETNEEDLFKIKIQEY